MSNQYARLMKDGLKLPPEAKGPDGRLVAFKPTGDQGDFVRTLASNGVSERIMAKILGISRETLDKYFSDEMQEGRDVVTAHMGAALVREGIAGNVAAIKYWLLTRGGPEWKLSRADMLALDPVNALEDAHARVHFYMPSNNRDKPETLEEPEAPVIDGAAEEPNVA